MNRFAKTAGFLILVHILISITFIVFPSFQRSSLVSKVYTRYLIPGPFFSENRITENRSLFIRWKRKGEWSIPVNPAHENYTNYFLNVNPELLYQSRLDRALYQKWMTSGPGTDAKSVDSDFQNFVLPYYVNRYVPAGADSIEVIFIRQQASDFKIVKDTLFIQRF